MEKRVEIKDVLQELSEVIADEFVATYQREETSIIMRIPSGQQFRISVEETV